MTEHYDVESFRSEIRHFTIRNILSWDIENCLVNPKVSPHKVTLLAEMILIRLPLPILYVRPKINSSWIWLDTGIEFVSTLKVLINNEVNIINPKFAWINNGDYFKDFHPKYQRRINETIIQVCENNYYTNSKIVQENINRFLEEFNY